MKKLLYLLLVLFVIPLTNKAQSTESKASHNPSYRTVYWVHGLGGDVSSLKTLSDYFSAKYKINSYYIAYPTNRGIKEAANQLSGLSVGLNPRKDDIVITHSMGGLVSRKYYIDYTNRRFGGIMTLNSPHLGSEFASSFDNGKIQTFFNKVTWDGVEGYRKMDAHVIGSNYHQNVLNTIGLFESLNDLRADIRWVGAGLGGLTQNSVATWSVDALTNVAFVFFKDKLIAALNDNVVGIVGLAGSIVFGVEEQGWPYTKGDVKPNSQVVTELKNAPIDCPRIALTGTVSNNAGISFLGSRLSASIQSNPGIGQVDSQAFLKYINAIISDSRKCEDEYARLYSAGSWFNFGLSNSYFSDKRWAFSRQANFWLNGFEREYQKCLGSIYYTTETQIYTYMVNVCDGDGAAHITIDPFIDGDMSEGDGCWREITETRIVTVQRMHPNDGLITLPSQKGMVGPTHNIEGNDHEKVKRSKETVDYIESQFKNQSSYFYCESK